MFFIENSIEVLYFFNMGTTGQSITLANSIIGVGILAMPFCFQQCGVLLATLILMSMGLMSRLCCYFLLKSAIITRRRNYEFLAFHVFGPAGKMAVETGIIGFLMGTCIAYFVVVGDLGPQIIAKILNINQSDTLRTSIMVIVSLVCVLPLGLLRNVDSLSNVSAATIAFYFCLVIKVITEATSQLLTSDWHTRIEMWKPAGVLQCVPIFSMALFCQTQLFEIFESMPSVSLEKMCSVTRNAIHICSAVYLTLGLFGYIAFGSREISGNILMSLSPTWASDVIKLGFVMSLAFSFPLIIFPCRASLYSFLYRKAHPSQHDHIINHSIPEGTFRLMTVGIVGAALVVSLLLPNVELVLGLLGATVGVLVCVVFPAACFLNVTYKDTNERLLAKFVVVLGLFILVLGTFANLQAAENTRDKYDDPHITKERIDKIVEDFFHQQEESEAAMAKPNLKVSMDPGNDKAVESNIIKDSEVQPPNPVPPESQSNEKNVHQTLEGKKDDKPRETLQEIKDTLNKDTESHPRNLKLKTNGESIVKNDNNEDNLENKNIENEKQEKISNSQEKSDILRQQQLMETIKQHGEEQKELIKEQKVILEEILKTKKELESKKEEENNEAKKIAVESIQKIANMAIKSIGGVTEKPINLMQDNKSAQLENIASAAVDEIAKKAVETLDAIKHINNPSNKVNKLVDIITNGEKENPEHIREKLIQNQQNGPEQGKLILNAVKQQVDEASHHINKGNVSQLNGGKLDNSEIIQKRNVKHPESLSVEKKANEIKPAVKENSSSLLSEKTPIEKNNQNNLKLNTPIAVALNGNETLNNGKQIQKVNDNSEITNKETKNNMPTKEDEKNISMRQKREVVDCTETKMLKPEDKQICENLVNKPVKDTSNFILPEVDLADVGLAKNIPLDILSVHHIRSLKSHEEAKKR